MSLKIPIPLYILKHKIPISDSFSSKSSKHSLLISLLKKETSKYYPNQTLCVDMLQYKIINVPQTQNISQNYYPTT